MAHLFDVSTSVACISIKAVCEAIDRRFFIAIKFLHAADLVNQVFPRFFFPDTEALTYQTTPFCTLKDMCACATEFGKAGTVFGGLRLPRQAVSDCLSFVHAGP